MPNQKPGNRKRRAQENETGWVTVGLDSGRGEMTDYRNGMVSAAIPGEAGTLYVLKQPDGSTAALFAFDHQGLWFAHVVVLSAAATPVTGLSAVVGPRLSLMEVCTDAGIEAGRMVREAVASTKHRD
jgi:hypothetical protein